ncbi:MAG: ABC transporter permease [Chloroflexi bacterium]|nr:ABC transporter permease [Chloroflexota bacterium]MDA1145385.1 ABC transporter permease [Chloroflexota bacterium]
MGTYIARRLALMPLLLLGVVTVVFVVSRTASVDPIASIVPERLLGNEEIVSAARARWGLDKSAPEQYALYIKNLAQGDMGTSFRTKQPVGSDIADKLPATLELTLAALAVAIVIGIPAGIAAAIKRDTWIDHTVRLFALVGSSLPVFWTGLILLYIFFTQLGIAPGPGRIDLRATPPNGVTGLYTVDAVLAGDFGQAWDALRHLMLPAFVLGWAVLGIIARMVRASMLEVLNQDYIRTARAKGLTGRQVIFTHALRNALIPTVTILGLSLAALLTGAVLTETVFAWPGLGSYAVESTRGLDLPAVMGVAIFGGAMFVIANLAIDISYGIIDPRIRVS